MSFQDFFSTQASINLPKFRSSTLKIHLPAMSQHSGGGGILLQQHNIIFYYHYRLSSENVSSPYDDRLDKLDPEGNTILPGPTRNRLEKLILAATSFRENNELYVKRFLFQISEW